MRVISGTARGTKLKTLSGTDIVRPTTDRVKESLFNIIQFDIMDSNVLDIFCGSGSLGIEALSRYASHCDFVDANSASINTAKLNASATHLDSKSAFYKSDYEAYIKTCGKKYDLIFADPPYASGVLPNLLSLIEDNGILSENGIFMFETSSDTDPCESDSLNLCRTAVYGNTKIFFYKNQK